MNGALEIGNGLSTALRRFSNAQAPVIAYIVGLAIVEVAVYLVERDPSEWGWPVFVGFILAQNWLWWSLMAAALTMSDERPAGLATFGVGITTFIQLLVVMIVMTVPIVLGTLLLIVPGVYLALMWSMVSASIISGHARWFASVGESARLTKGNRWRIFVLLLVPVLVAMPLQIAVHMRDDPTERSLLYVASFLVMSFASAYMVFVIATIYDRLRTP